MAEALHIRCKFCGSLDPIIIQRAGYTRTTRHLVKVNFVPAVTYESCGCAIISDCGCDESVESDNQVYLVDPDENENYIHPREGGMIVDPVADWDYNPENYGELIDDPDVVLNDWAFEVGCCHVTGSSPDWLVEYEDGTEIDWAGDQVKRKAIPVEQGHQSGGATAFENQLAEVERLLSGT